MRRSMAAALILTVLLFGGAYLTTGGSAAQEPESGDDTAQEPFAADESYEAVVLDAEKAKLLGVNAGNCAFYHQRLTRTEDGRIYEYTRSFIRGDRVRLDVHMQKSGMNFVRTID